VLEFYTKTQISLLGFK